MGDTYINTQDTDYQRYLTLKNEVFQNYFQAVEVDNQYYNLDYPNVAQIIPREWGARGIKPTVPPPARNAVDNLADHILTTPRVCAPPRPPEDDIPIEQALAERNRQFNQPLCYQVVV